MSVLPLRYVDSGETQLPLLVFLHGWPDSAALWKRQVAHFAGRYRTVCAEWPRFGADRDGVGSDFSDIAERLAETIRVVTTTGRPPEIVLVGHDWGAYLSYVFEQKHAGMIDRFVTLDVGAHFRPKNFKHVAAIVSYQWWLVAAFFIGKVCAPLGDAMARAFARYVRAPEADATRAAMGYPYFYFWRARLLRKYRGRLIRRYRPTKPLLYLYGAKNPVPFHSKRWESTVRESPHSEVVPVDGMHWFLLSQSAKVNTAMDRWLTRRDTGGSR